MQTSTPFVLRNARIHTFGPAGTAEAVALRGGLVLAVGSEADVYAAVGSDAPSVNVGGRTVLPGLTDAHVHWGGYALQRRRLTLTAADGLSDVQRKVRKVVADGDADSWLLGRGWDHATWGRWPTAADLDAVAPSRPVALTRKDGHVVWLNSRALQACSIGDATPNPPGGEIERDGEGRATGILKETAKELANAVIPPATSAQRQAAIIDAWPEAWCRGLTAMHDMGLGRQSLFHDLATLRDAGELGARFVWYLQQDELPEALGLGLRSGLGDPWLRIGGLKLFLDGTLGSQTADMLAPYEDQPNNRGLPIIEFEHFCELVDRAAEGRLATAVHAIGDGANRKALDAFAHVAARHDTSALRQRVEHVQILDPSDVPRFARENVIASMQPIHATADMDVADRFWGDRAAYAYAWRSVLDSGAHLAFGSDAPIEPLDVFAGVHAAVTRQRADGEPRGGWRREQAITVAEALRAYTVGAAYAGGVEDELGSLEPGKRADLIVLDRDPFSLPSQDLPHVAVQGTMIDGVWVWQDSGARLSGPQAT